MKIERFEDIEAWRLARELTRKAYRLYVALDEEYISSGEFKEVYDQAGRTRAAVRGFINYLRKYEKSKTTNPEP